jgi:hypothetical protein
LGPFSNGPRWLGAQDLLSDPGQPPARRLLIPWPCIVHY